MSAPNSASSISRNSLKSARQESVKVCVRCRPMTEKEISQGHERVVEMDPKKGIVTLHPLGNANKSSSSNMLKQFTFDAVYDWNSRQADVYDEVARPLVDSVLEGFNGTVFAYGQTGTGKTYTMVGNRDDPSRRGIIPNAFEHIFSHIARSNNQQYLVRSSYLEIYQEQVRDLLCKDQSKRLELKERADIGVYVKDLSSFVCKSIKEIEHVMTVGNENRAVGATNMNEQSSRSHALFIITIEHSQTGPDGQSHIRVGKLNLVDLAGSERQFKTGVVAQRQKEAIKINLSLSALGNVISALVDGKSTHIPYRDSKLTRLLQDSLGGNSKTVMIANIGPASYNYEETLITLRYASRAKNIKNRPRVNEDPKDALLREFQSEIERLKYLLSQKKHRTSSAASNRSSSNESLISKTDNGLMMDTEAVEQLALKIKSMESKLLCGGKNIIDHTNEQQRELEKKKQEIADQKRREREVLQKLEEQEESTVEVKETFTSMQQEVELKKRKLKKLFAKLQSVRGEIDDCTEANGRERRELEELQNELTKELKLKYLVIENFIPLEEKNFFLSKVSYDEDEEEWKYCKPKCDSLIITKRPVSRAGILRPTTEYSRIAASLGHEARHLSDNVLKMQLLMPTRLTKDYNVPPVSARIKAALDSAITVSDEVFIDASQITSCRNDIPPLKIRNRSKSSIRLSNNNHRPKTGLKANTAHPQSFRPGTGAHFTPWNRITGVTQDYLNLSP
ncbi:kinesin-like protein KIF3B [Brevipalpus obovatus]|uniref:kinesin-like protein KIF3B n=1 Tax=Brevipalpus obovatus TaxID=246614 RepID=UPI003D9F64C5